MARMRLFVVIATTFITLPLLAKGLDDIQPTDKSEKAADKSKPTSGDGQSDAPQPAATTVPAGKTAPDAKKTAVVPSALSKALAEKLHLSASYGFIRIPKAQIGSMSAQGMADVMILWNFIDEAEKDYKVLLTLRYAPIHSENEIEGQSYKSIIEGYHVGAQYRYRFLHKDLDLIASAELGYLLVYQESRDKYSGQEDSEKNELAYTLGTGLEWVLMEKVSVGPRLYAGFGNIQIVQVAGSATFTF